MEKKKPSDELAIIYQKFRLVGGELEEFIAANTPPRKGITDQDVHRLDKSSVVLKMAFKDIKRILRGHGITGLKKAAENMRVIAIEK